jgi:ABC-2 type transport system ATP-binding protein
MIQVDGLTKKYGERIAVNEISFTVNRGEILGFLGQNGAGKTTTMKILTGYMPATAGKAKIAGFDVFENPLEVKSRIGYLPETPPVYPELLVDEYLSFIAELRGVPKAEREKKKANAIELCNLGDVRYRLIGNLSKGYRQRVGLAQAILHEPEVLVLDEPTVGLDPKQVSEIRKLIKSMAGSRTIIYSTHILTEVAATCDRILVIEKGKLVAQEALNEFGATGEVVKTEIVMNKSSDKAMTAVQKVPGVKNVRRSEEGTHRFIVETEAREDALAEVARAVVESGAGLVRMAPVALALEEYYLNLISGRISA